MKNTKSKKIKTNFSAGTLASPNINSSYYKKYPQLKRLWVMDDEGNYRMGNWYHRTPEQLWKECHSIIRDLMINHAELIK